MNNKRVVVRVIEIIDDKWRWSFGGSQCEVTFPIAKIGIVQTVVLGNTIEYFIRDLFRDVFGAHKVESSFESLIEIKGLEFIIICHGWGVYIATISNS